MVLLHIIKADRQLGMKVRMSRTSSILLISLPSLSLLACLSSYDLLSTWATSLSPVSVLLQTSPEACINQDKAKKGFWEM